MGAASGRTRTRSTLSGNSHLFAEHTADLFGQVHELVQVADLLRRYKHVRVVHEGPENRSRSMRNRGRCSNDREQCTVVDYWITGGLGDHMRVTQAPPLHHLNSLFSVEYEL